MAEAVSLRRRFYPCRRQSGVRGGNFSITRWRRPVGRSRARPRRWSPRCDGDSSRYNDERRGPGSN